MPSAHPSQLAVVDYRTGNCRSVDHKRGLEKQTACQKRVATSENAALRSSNGPSVGVIPGQRRTHFARTMQMHRWALQLESSYPIRSESRACKYRKVLGKCRIECNTVEQLKAHSSNPGHLDLSSRTVSKGSAHRPLSDSSSSSSCGFEQVRLVGVTGVAERTRSRNPRNRAQSSNRFGQIRKNERLSILLLIF